MWGSCRLFNHALYASARMNLSLNGTLPFQRSTSTQMHTLDLSRLRPGAFAQEKGEILSILNTLSLFFHMLLIRNAVLS